MRIWRLGLAADPFPGGLQYDMDFATGINHAWLPANLRAQLDAAEAAGRQAADERPL